MRQIGWAITALLIIAWLLKLNDTTTKLNQHNQALLQIIDTLEDQEERLQILEGTNDVY